MKLYLDSNRVDHELGDKFGLFFEDINHAADGGLYAELVQNRSFEFDPIDNREYHALTAWEPVQRGMSFVHYHVEDREPLHKNNKHYLVLESMRAGDGAGIANTGFAGGIPIVEGERYSFSVFARLLSDEVAPLVVRLEDQHGSLLADEVQFVPTNTWTKFAASIRAFASCPDAKLVLLSREKIRVAIDMVSLFPPTYKDRDNGMRRDLATALAAMKPKFLRFPGGCLVHDGSLDAEDRNSMYRWKNTIGPVEHRPTKRSNWGYNQSLGLGYYEYFLLCEDIGAKPIPVLPAGYDPHHFRAVPLDEMQPWIDDALDLIEFANGSVESRLGKIRADLGHPEPFDLEYLAIGNEEVGQAFFDRYALFHEQIRQRYPEIKIINSAGPFAAGGEYDRGWASAREHGSDYVDEHYYMLPEWMVANSDRYLDFDRNGPKVFLGEFASFKNTWRNALAEAVYMCGLEKAAAVGLVCYAPLLMHVHYRNWPANLIWFDKDRVSPTSSYHVQRLFMEHQGTHSLEVELEDAPVVKAATVDYSGDIILRAMGQETHFTKIELLLADGSIQYFDDMSLTDEPYVLAKNVDGNFKLNFSFEKQASKDYSRLNQAGIEVRFREKHDDEHFVWILGGWQNQDSMIEMRKRGTSGCLTQSLFTVQAEHTYDCSIWTKGDEIFTEVDDLVINEAAFTDPGIKPLYYSASLDAPSGDLILKAVNIYGEDQALNISLGDDRFKTCTVYTLGGFEDDIENSLEDPNRITPQEQVLPVVGNQFSYTLNTNHFVVLRFS